jgi:hypothetical protein
MQHRSATVVQCNKGLETGAFDGHVLQWLLLEKGSLCFIGS